HAKTRSGTGLMERLESLKLYTTAILNVMHSFRVKQMNEEQSMESALTWICENLAERQVILDNDSLLQRLLEREKAGGLGIPSTSITLFHTRSRLVAHPNLTVHSLHSPIT